MRRLRRLAVLSALGLGALAFAVPAQAGDGLSPPPVPPPHADRTVTIVVDVPEGDVPDAQPAPAPAEPNVDAPPAEDPAPIDDAVRPVETPANQPTAPSSTPVGPPQEATAPASTTPSQPAAVATPVRAAKTPARKASVRRSARQYQSPEPQYQSVATHSLDRGARREAEGFRSKLRVPPADTPDAPWQAVRDIKRGGWNCAENIPQPSPLCAPDACEKLSWKCCWIDTCTSGIPVIEEPSAPSVPEPETPSSPATCTGADPSGPQYQSGAGQYQPPAGPDDEDFGDDADDDAGGAELDPCQQGPVAAPGNETTPPSAGDTTEVPDAAQPASEPAGPAATAASGQPAGSADAVSATPPPEARPAIEPVAAPEQRVETGAPAGRVGAVLGETASAVEARPTHGPARPRPARRAKSKPSLARVSAPPERAVAARAEASTTPTGRGNSPGMWLAFGAAALMALALSSFALTVGPRPRASALSGVRARIGSRGLSAKAPIVPKPPHGVASRGIRYRD